MHIDGVMVSLLGRGRSWVRALVWSNHTIALVLVASPLSTQL